MVLDEDLRQKLKIIDKNEDVEVTNWEADFIESIVYKYPNRPLTARQMEISRKIINKYWDFRY